MAKKVKAESTEKSAPVKKGKKFLVKTSKRIGSNKDGSAKETYVKGKYVYLSDRKKIETLQSLNII